MQGKNELYTQYFFQHVNPETIDKLWKAGRVKQFPKGHLLLRARDSLKQICIQLTGKSAVYSLTHTGKRKIIFIYGEGYLLNEQVLREETASLFCETLETSKVFVVPKTFFVKCMEEDFTLTRAVLEVQEHRLRRMGRQLKNTMGSVHMEQKLAAKLFKLSKDFGRKTAQGIEIDLNLPVTLLADMLGSSRETTSRMCGTLMDLGLITMEKKKITVRDQEKLLTYYRTGKME